MSHFHAKGIDLDCRTCFPSLMYQQEKEKEEHKEQEDQGIAEIINYQEKKAIVLRVKEYNDQGIPIPQILKDRFYAIAQEEVVAIFRVNNFFSGES